jgi:hypothetical protein
MSNKNQIQTFFTNLYQDSLEKFDQDFRETDPRKIQGITQIALIGAIASWLALPIYILGQALTGQIQFQSLAYNNLILAIGLSITYLLARLKIKMIPALLTALLVEVTFIRANFYIDGLGIILGIILLAIVINVAMFKDFQQSPQYLSSSQPCLQQAYVSPSTCSTCQPGVSNPPSGCNRL